MVDGKCLERGAGKCVHARVERSALGDADCVAARWAIDDVQFYNRCLRIRNAMRLQVCGSQFGLRRTERQNTPTFWNIELRPRFSNQRGRRNTVATIAARHGLDARRSVPHPSGCHSDARRSNVDAERQRQCTAHNGAIFPSAARCMRDTCRGE
jgi:hypothetical protein